MEAEFNDLDGFQFLHEESPISRLRRASTEKLMRSRCTLLQTTLIVNAMNLLEEGQEDALLLDSDVTSRSQQSLEVASPAMDQSAESGRMHDDAYDSTKPFEMVDEEDQFASAQGHYADQHSRPNLSSFEEEWLSIFPQETDSSSTANSSNTHDADQLHHIVSDSGISNAHFENSGHYFANLREQVSENYSTEEVDDSAELTMPCKRAAIETTIISPEFKAVVDHDHVHSPKRRRMCMRSPTCMFVV